MARATLLTTAVVLLLVLPLTAAAQQSARDKRQGEGKARKLYCWNEGNERICSDTLPADAVNNAREEFNARTGQRSAQVGAALNADVRADAAVEAEQARLDLMAQQTRQRTEQALLSNYPDEAALRTVFNERASILDNTIATARYNVASLREGLFTALASAGERELAGAKVSDKQTEVIRQRHAQLRAQQRLQAGFERQRQELDAEVEATLLRFRQLKGL